MSDVLSHERIETRLMVTINAFSGGKLVMLRNTAVMHGNS
jgi:hypothetical protein